MPSGSPGGAEAARARQDTGRPSPPPSTPSTKGSDRMAKEGRTVDRATGEVTEGTVRPFADVLRDLGKGQVADEAAVLLTDLVTAVVTYGKKGIFTLKIAVAPFKGNT